ncbi:hypothetical protein [Mycolicibacterium frederiksbergense]|uniref:hypothetical protein n=1 Tax=Mycolicibacterium frederiksbergense TaxID=117567 RepID=UPI00399BDDDC
MTTMINRRSLAGGHLLAGDRLEWRQRPGQPSSITARKFQMDDGETDLWVATQCGVYVGADALFAKHREMLGEHYDESRPMVVKFSVAYSDWAARNRNWLPS